MMAAEAHARALYRSILRELPPRTSVTAPSSIRSSIRKHFAEANVNASAEYRLARRQEAEQFVQYLKAQRTYDFLLERYNPGMSMNEEERVRLTARRVGMEMPVEWRKNKS
jgi:ATP synthase assembly factor FMC1, mitochondrial